MHVTEPHLVPGQDLEGSHDLVRRVGICRLAGHEVNEGLKCHYAQAVGVHDAHDTGKLCLSLEGTANPQAPSAHHGQLGRFQMDLNHLGLRVDCDEWRSSSMVTWAVPRA